MPVCSMQKTADGILNFSSRCMLNTVLVMLFMSLPETSSNIILLALQTAQFKLSLEIARATPVNTDKILRFHDD
jgi:hypothetical protein